MSIDWSKAPSSATHYLPEQKDLGWEACWYKKDGDKWLVLNCARLEKRGHMEWVVDDSEVDKFVPLLVPRSAFSSEWNGQGLPPVGTVCIVEPHNTMWGFSSTSGYERKILAYYGEYVWLGHAETPLETTRIDKVDFRPIRPPEQIAAEERSKECDRIFVILSSVEREGNRSDMAEALYDAGYRRQEEGK
ncbi:hypothetical protein ISD91_27480 [Pseudomonas aeruginosa]|nr:hypothetical protein [Pseudomonas aeruginosa]MBX5792018.1 hypothetical protein [Pseudomonas aeruginosa]